jgi:Tfp pilus assembly protein PilF
MPGAAGFSSSSNALASSPSSGNPASTALATAGNSISNGFRKAKGAVGTALSPAAPASWSAKKADVTGTDDATRLSTPVPKINPRVYITAGKLLEARGDVEGAIRKHEEALRQDPKDMEALMSIAHLCDRHSRFDDAVRFYGQAIEVDPKYPTAHNDLGLCLARQGRLREAHQEISAAISLQPSNPRYRNNLATVCLDMGAREEALQQLVEANGPAVGHYNLGQMLYQRGEVDQAKGLFAKAVTLDPRLVPAQEMLQRVDGVQQQAQATLSQVHQATHESRQALIDQAERLRGAGQSLGQDARAAADQTQANARQSAQEWRAAAQRFGTTEANPAAAPVPDDYQP